MGEKNVFAEPMGQPSPVRAKSPLGFLEWHDGWQLVPRDRFLPVRECKALGVSSRLRFAPDVIVQLPGRLLSKPHPFHFEGDRSQANPA